MTPVLFADAGFWPIIIFAVVAMLLGGNKKKAPPRNVTPLADDEGPRGGGLMGELSRALAELKRAEQEALAKREAHVTGVPAPERKLAKGASPATRRSTGVAPVRGQGTAGGSARGGDLVKRQVYAPKPAQQRSRKVVPRPVEFDPDQTFEDPTVISLERGLGHDEDAELLMARRRQAVEQRDGARENVSVEEMSAAQLARRADRAPATAIGGRAEHDTWHQRIEAERTAAAAPVAAARAASPLARFATGRMRDAVILTEILGRPVGER